MKKEMLINVLQPEECRIAIVEDGQLEELYVERSSQESYVGNIYKGRIVNIEPSIQAAFVDFGIGRNGFLHVSDVDPAYYKHLLSKEALAEYENDIEREYGDGGRGPRQDRDDRGGRGRDRDRSDRGGRGSGFREPAQPSSWLQPQPAGPAPVDEDAIEGFSEGLDGGAAPAPEAVDEEPIAPFTEGFEEPEAVAPPPRQRPQPPAPRPAPAAPVEDDEFGAGLYDDGFAEGIADASTLAQPGDVNVAADAGEAVAETESEEPKKKPRARRPRKADETKAEDATAGDEGEAKPKRARRTKKKTDGEGEAAEGGEAPPDVPPLTMGGAERRTSPPGDEPEIQPFFEGADDFDPDAPNDRFANGEPAEEPAIPVDDAEEFEPETAEAAEEEAREVEKEVREAPAAGRGFNDDFDDARPEPRGDRGGRDRDRGRGGRDRDRGDRGRGGRDRDRDDRGPRTGGGRGPDRGPRFGNGGPGGPKGGRDRGLPKPPIQEIFKRGQEVIVQVIKEGIGTKGPTLSTYVSIAGRYLVLMPSLNRVGVSRKIEDHEARRRLRDIMATLGPPKGVGFIVRTAAIDRDAQELRNDLAYLLRLWQVVVKRIKRVAAPVEIYRESDMITRTIRDIFTADVSAIYVDEPAAFEHAREFLQIVMPKYADRIRHFDGTEPLFHKYGIEEEIARIHQKRIELPEGGSIIIEQTEALVAIDVNSGNFRAENNAEETAYQMNLRAAKEIARQLRLRDLGGVIVNDFIDMRGEAHRRNVENALRDAMRRDRARTKILRISQFGIIEMTRQRIRPSLKRSIFADCPHCRGTGFVKTAESASIEVMRLVQLAAHRAPAVQSVHVTVHQDVAHYLQNRRRRELARLEERANFEVVVTGQTGVSPDLCLVKCFDHNGAEVRLIPPAPVRLAGGRVPHGRPQPRFPQQLD